MVDFQESQNSNVFDGRLSVERVDSDKFPRIVREESHGLRKPRFFPGEQSRISQPMASPGRKQLAWRFRSDSHQCPSRGSLLALATPLRSVNTADAALRIGTISQAHAIPRWACIYLMVRFAPFFLLRASMQSALSGATKWPTGPFRLRAALEFELAPGFVDGDGRAVGQVKASQARAHRQSHLLGNMRAEHDIRRIGDIARLRAEQQNICRSILDLRVQLRRMRSERDDPGIRHRFDEIIKIRMQHYMRHVMVIQSSAAQLRIMQIESKRLDQMQNRPRHRAQANRRPRIAGDTWRVVAQVRRARLGFRRILGTHHRIRHIDRIAVRVGDELIRTIIRLAIPVFEHRLDFRLRIRR